jgi:hypothetical protein
LEYLHLADKYLVVSNIEESLFDSILKRLLQAVIRVAKHGAKDVTLVLTVPDVSRLYVAQILYVNRYRCWVH